MHATEDAIAGTILALCRARGPDRTLCPSEVARRLAADGEWRSMMDDVRAVAAKLAAQGEIVVTQRGQHVDIGAARGPVRLGLPES